MSAKFPSPGEVFEDTYRIEAILGSGGFARVYRAVEVGLERHVALKILRPPVDNDQSDSQRDSYLDTLMERFQREAMMLSKLRSPYTVNLFKYGKTDRGLLYMALEYIDGLSLAEIMRAGKPLEPARVAKILEQVLASLQEAHHLGMLHRDLKPANVMVYEHLGEKDQVKLLDFGIAKLVSEVPGESQKDLTSDGTLIGTPRYMSPEQIQGGDIGPPADIYALGLVAYELLTGQRAIKGDSSIQIIGKQLAPQSFQLPREGNLPAGLRNVINKMMEKDLAARYRQCDEVIEDLRDPDLLKVAFKVPDFEVSSDDIERLDGAIETMEDIPTISDDSLERLDPLERLDNTHLRDDTKDEPGPDRPWRPTLIVAVPLLIAFILVTSVIALLTGEEEPETLPVEEPEIAVKEPVEPTVKPVPKVKITAKYDGRDVEGATVLVDGVEKGVTPLTLEAPEIANSHLVARYTVRGSGDALEETQEVTDPRDVLFEFDAAVGELIPPEPEEPEPNELEPKELEPKELEPKPAPEHKPPKPRPTKPEKEESDPYFVPE